MNIWTIDALDEVIEALNGGGVIAYPTEAVYGLGCDPRNTRAITKLCNLKRRNPDLGFLLIGADLEQISSYVEWRYVSKIQRDEVLRTWPGPNTWVLPAATGVSRLLTGTHKGIAVRVTAHSTAAELCRKFAGPLISTSANIHGNPPARSLEELYEQFSKSSLDGVLIASLGDAQNPSIIRDALTGKTLRGG
jgi:L-threonylcarbamoyladenylate synthase